MAKLFIENTTLTAIADAIREKNGEVGGVATTILDKDSDLVDNYYSILNCSEEESAALGALETGDVVTWMWTYNGTEYTSTGAVEVSKGGTYQAGAVIFPNVTTVLANIDLEPKSLIYLNGIVEVPYIASDASIHTSHLKITTDGAAAYTPLQMPAAILAIEGGGMTPSGELEIVENGSYDVTEYASAQVSVPTGVFPEGTFPITENGEYNIESYANVVVDVAASGGGDLEPVVLSGNCDYACAGDLANSVIPQMKGKITTNNIYQAPYMFYNSGLAEIPFELNFYPNYDMTEVNSMFQNAGNLKKFPTIKNLNPKNASQMFAYCHELTNIPEGATSTWSFDKWHTSTAAQVQHMFRGCYRLRHIDSNLLQNLWNCNTLYLYNLYYYLFSECYALDEVRNLGVSTATLTGNAFNNTFYECAHLKNFTFVGGKSASWSNQVIDLTTVGYFPGWGVRSDDFTMDLKVTDLASYEALNGNSAWWTSEAAFSRYNHDSAVATINSLPTITASGATNTIKFRGNMGSGYGKAISDLTEAEIAVATAKGWTVSIT